MVVGAVGASTVRARARTGRDPVVLGIDIGTYGSRAVACRPDGTIVAEATAAHDVSYPRPGFAEHDADGVWWHDCHTLARRIVDLLPRSYQVAAVGTSACGPCLVPVDPGGRPLRPGILYGIDVRATQQVEALTGRWGSRNIAALGGTLTSQSVGPKILWIGEHEPDVFRRTARFLTATGYLVLRLTGIASIDHHQGSYFAPFVDSKRRRWDLRFASGLLTEEQLPRLYWSDDVVGHITAEAAAITGLPEGTPVVAGTSDGMCEAISVGATTPGIVMVNYGSTIGIMTGTPKARRSPRLWATAGATRGTTALGGGLATAGTITTWFRQEFARELPQGTTREIEGAHAALTAEAMQSPVGSRGLLALPYFSGERTPFNDPAARGVLVGLGLTHRRGDIYRAILESTAFGLRHNLEEFRRAGAKIHTIRAVGGGARSRLWPQIVSDVTGYPQEIPTSFAGPASGAALLACLGVGLGARTRLMGGDWTRVGDRIEPGGTEVQRRYGELYVSYRRLYKATRDIVHDLATEPTNDGHEDIE